MCGLLYAFRQNGASASKTVLKRFRKQRTRGTQGFGYITVKEGKIGEVKRFEEEKSMVASLEKEKANEILFHHRIPTGTPNFEDLTHPIVVKNSTLKRNYYVIHNGVISNDTELKAEHEKLGFEYTTDMTKKTTYETKNFSVIEDEEHFFNDSEVFAIDLALFLEDKQVEIKTEGSIAFICFETDKKNNIKKIHYGHNSQNPLILEKNRDMFVLKSEGHGEGLEADVLMTMDYKTKEVVKNDVNIGQRHTYEKKIGFCRGENYDWDDYNYEHEYEKNGKKKENFNVDDYYQSLQDELEDLKKQKKDIEIEMVNVRVSVREGQVDDSDNEVIEFFSTSRIQIEDLTDSIDELEKELETQADLFG